MEFNNLVNGLQRIEASGIRSFKAEHAKILHDDLKQIPDKEWSFLVYEFLEIEYGHAKSMTGWFWRRYRELKKETEAKQPWKKDEQPMNSPEELDEFLAGLPFKVKRKPSNNRQLKCVVEGCEKEAVGLGLNEGFCSEHI